MVNKMERELICISCPKGCHLKVDVTSLKVSGNSCPKGAEYGVNEVTNPVRIVTSTVKVNGGDTPVVPVKTQKAIPKGLITKCMEEINKVTVEVPVKIGDIVIKNVLETGVDIVAVKNVF
jgi:CxxC motif-containing protein